MRRQQQPAEFVFLSHFLSSTSVLWTSDFTLLRKSTEFYRCAPGFGGFNMFHSSTEVLTTSSKTSECGPTWEVSPVDGSGQNQTTSYGSASSRSSHLSVDEGGRKSSHGPVLPRAASGDVRIARNVTANTSIGSPEGMGLYTQRLETIITMTFQIFSTVSVCFESV